MNIRPFEDLIKPIKYDGETFVPIEEIAKLAIAPNLGVKLKKCLPELMEVDYQLFRVSVKHHYSTDEIIIFIDGIFNISMVENSVDCNVHNQVQIVKNLIKWGFIEP